MRVLSLEDHSIMLLAFNNEHRAFLAGVYGGMHTFTIGRGSHGDLEGGY